MSSQCMTDHQRRRALQIRVSNGNGSKFGVRVWTSSRRLNHQSTFVAAGATNAAQSHT